MSGSLTNVRIVIADDQPIFRDGLRRLLQTNFGLQVVGHASCVVDAAALLRSLDASLLLLGLPGAAPEPLKALRELAALGVQVSTIILTDGIGSAEAAEALRLGARGVVPKNAVIEVLLESISAVMAGRYWFGCERATDADDWRKRAAASRPPNTFGLTERELEIVQAVTDGNTNREIATRLSISENTVKRHVTHAFDKLGASNRVELAVFAAHHRVLRGNQPGTSAMGRQGSGMQTSDR
jgi:DNA-binding NarL/FixJ family response regulator